AAMECGATVPASVADHRSQEVLLWLHEHGVTTTFLCVAPCAIIRSSISCMGMAPSGCLPLQLMSAARQPTVGAILAGGRRRASLRIRDASYEQRNGGPKAFVDVLLQSEAVRGFERHETMDETTNTANRVNRLVLIEVKRCENGAKNIQHCFSDFLH